MTPIQTESLELLNNQMNWVNWPFMPVKKYQGEGKFPIFGVVLPEKSIVYRIGLFEITTGDLKPQLDAVEQHAYASMDALVQDGWEVD